MTWQHKPKQRRKPDWSERTTDFKISLPYQHHGQTGASDHTVTMPARNLAIPQPREHKEPLGKELWASSAQAKSPALMSQH